MKTMKLNKLEFSQMMKNMLVAYNQFFSSEDLESRVEAYYEKLQWQPTLVLQKVMKGLTEEKMPNAAQLLKKCLDYKFEIQKNTPMLPSEQLCRYSRQGECATSRWLCGYWPITPEWAQECTRNHGTVLCYWHWKVWQAEMASLRDDLSEKDNPWHWVDWMISVRKDFLDLEEQGLIPEHFSMPEALKMFKNGRMFASNHEMHAANDPKNQKQSNLGGY